MTSPSIQVRGARTHNLKGIDCRVPHGQLTVVTGPSGGGEVVARFRHHLRRGAAAVRRVDVDLRPAVSRSDGATRRSMRSTACSRRWRSRQKNSVRNARSTVGTVTETLDVLRLLFTHLGEVHCPNGHGPVDRSTPQQVAAALADGDAGEAFLLVVRVPRPQDQADRALHELVRLGFRRVLGEEGFKFASAANHIDHPLRLMFKAINSLLFCGTIEMWSRCAASEFTLEALDVHHIVTLMFSAIFTQLFAWKVKTRLHDTTLKRT